FIFYAFLGLVGGLVSVWFVKMILWMRPKFLALPEKTRWFQPAAGGLLVGILGCFVPQVLGVGYFFVGDALNGNMVLWMMALLVILKVLATTTSYASGNAGGIFGPSLFIGAMTGGTIGSLAHAFLPMYTGSPGAYALVGMGTAFAGIVRVPLTSVIMIFEMTRDYTIIVPLMISNLVSFYVSYRLQRKPIYEALASQDGIHLPNMAEQKASRQLRVSAATRTPVATIAPNMTRTEALALLDTHHSNQLPVVEGNRFLGMISRVELENARTDLQSEIRPALKDKFPHLHSDHSLDLALHRMGLNRTNELPIVSRRDVHKLEGLVHLDDVLRLYGVTPENEPQE
ncbi:MAG TPA: chloride channel protein, partial [Terriglobia bacterium]|nr:chloride channel protein [Terriglobia bacterium]